MLTIGLTGGIGSGKTTVANIFEQLGTPVYYSDTKAKQIMLSPKITQQIKEYFGAGSYNENGELERDYLAREVFSDSTKLKKLNSMVHPAVQQDFEQWRTEQHTPFVIIESAILIESGIYKLVDEIVVVTAPQWLRIERVSRRDTLSQDSVKRRIAAQMSDQERMKYANYEIIADESELLLPQILRIEREIQKKIISLWT